MSNGPLRPLSERGILIVLVLTICLNGAIAIRNRDYAPRVAEITASILLALTSLAGVRRDDLPRD